MLRVHLLLILASARGLLASPAWCEGAPDCNAMVSSLEDTSITANTQYLTVEGSVTKWKSADTGYITVQPITTTISNKPVTTTQTVKFVVAPTTIVENGATVDSIDLVLSPGAIQDIEGLVGKFCGTGLTKIKRQEFSCSRPEQDLIQYLYEQFEGGLWATGLQDVINRYLLSQRTIYIAAAWIIYRNLKANMGRISQLDFGIDPKQAAKEASEETTTTTKQETTSILLFDDSLYTDSPEAYASMASQIDAMITEIAKTDTDWFPAPTGPWCVHGGAPNQQREPKEYCQCSDSKIYPVATSTASPYNACPYTSGQRDMPSTVVFSTPTPTPTPLPSEPQLECGMSSGDIEYPSLPYRVAMRQSGIEAALKNFCEKNAGKELNTDDGISYKYNPWGTDKEIGQGRQNIYLKAKYHSRDRCPATSKLDVDACKKAFSTLNNGCNTDTTIAKRGGSYFLDCVAYNLDGTGGADMYRLHFHQQMAKESASLEWTMYNSINEKVAGPEKVTTEKEGGMSGTIKGAPYDMKLSVSDATYKDRTNVEMTYPKDGGFYLSTWNTGKTDGKTGARSSVYYWCDDVRSDGAKGAWKGWGAGFEREFDCYFAAWRDNDLVLG